MRWSLKEAELDRSGRISGPMTPPSRKPPDRPRRTPTITARDRAGAALQLSMQNSVVAPIAPPMRAPPSRPMPAPAQKWPLVPSPLERRVTEVVGMTNAGLLDCARMSALWATPRLGARSSGRTMAAKRRGMRNLLGDETDGASRINASEGFNMHQGRPVARHKQSGSRGRRMEEARET